MIMNQCSTGSFLKSAVVYHDDTSKNINIYTTRPLVFSLFKNTLSHEKILEQIYPNNPITLATNSLRWSLSHLAIVNIHSNHIT